MINQSDTITFSNSMYYALEEKTLHPFSHRICKNSKTLSILFSFAAFNSNFRLVRAKITLLKPYINHFNFNQQIRKHVLNTYYPNVYIVLCPRFLTLFMALISISKTAHKKFMKISTVNYCLLLETTTKRKERILLQRILVVVLQLPTLV